MVINVFVQFNGGFLPDIVLLTQAPIFVWFDGTIIIYVITTLLTMYVCMYVCIFIKLHITAQSGPVIRVILCHSH